MPTMGSYSASKHALEGATEALWYEARPFGIRVNLVQLGFINSNSFKRVVLSKKAQLRACQAQSNSSTQFLTRDTALRAFQPMRWMCSATS